MLDSAIDSFLKDVLQTCISVSEIKTVLLFFFTEQLDYRLVRRHNFFCVQMTSNVSLYEYMYTVAINRMFYLFFIK